jgi:hypothetical protein
VEVVKKKRESSSSRLLFNRTRALSSLPYCFLSALCGSKQERESGKKVRVVCINCYFNTCFKPSYYFVKTQAFFKYPFITWHIPFQVLFTKRAKEKKIGIKSE